MGASGTQQVKSGRRAGWVIALLSALALLVGIALYAVLVEPYQVVVEEVRVPIAGLPAALDGLRIVHLRTRTSMESAGVRREPWSWSAPQDPI